MTFVNIIVLAIAYPIYLHFLGYEKYGVWLAIATVLSFLQIGGNLGIQPAVTKLVAEEYGRDNIHGAQSYVGMAIATMTISGTIGFVIVLLLRMPIIRAFRLSGENAVLASMLLPYVSLLCIYIFIVRVLNATLSGLGRIDLANYVQTGGRVVSVAVAAILLYVGRGIESLLIGNTISQLFIHILSVTCIRNIAHIHPMRLDNFDSGRCKRLLRFGGGVFGGSIASMLISPFNKLMLSRYVGVSSIPVYEIAFRASMQTRNLVEAGLKALVPEVSRLSENMTAYAKNRISQIISRATKLIFIFSVPVYGILIVFTPFMLKLWLGERFIDTLPGVFQIMLIGTFLTLIGIPSYFTAMGLGYVRHVLFAQVLQSCVNCFLIIVIFLTFNHLSVYSVACISSLAMVIGAWYVVLQTKMRLSQSFPP